MQVEIIAITLDSEKIIENAARTCYQSKPGEKAAVGDLIRRLVKSGHHSVLEHASATFRISGGSRAMTHQLVRHRLMAISQQSQRYVNESQFDYVVPPSIQKNDEAKQLFLQYMDNIAEMYRRLKVMGLKNEDARFVLPNACCSEIVISANFREFRHIFKVRCDKHAQWEIRYAAMKMLQILLGHAVSVFEDMASLIDPEWMDELGIE